MTICRSLITLRSELFIAWSGRVAWALLCAALLLWTPPIASAKSKHHRAPRPEPELKILDLNVSPNPLYNFVRLVAVFCLSPATQGAERRNPVGSLFINNVAVGRIRSVSDHA